jgi:ribosomal protein L11 methyltransferase
MFELVLRAPEALVEPVSDALIDELDALSVSVEDADAGSDGEQALFGEPGMAAPRPGWRRSTLSVLFPDEARATNAATLLLAQDWAQGLHVQSLAPLQDQDWVRLTQAQFAPLAIAEGFWVVPSWHAPPAGAQRIIRLDPGLAFGTGTHPTTRMCLRWIAAQGVALALPGVRVLDYGCGSGILAIGAALHGAIDIDAVDIDPAAVTATLANAQANGVQLQAGLPERAAGAYSLVLANILATPLKLLAPLLCARLRPGGQLVLAGILERQADELKAAYAPGLALQVSDAQEGWILMTGHLAGPPAPVPQ